MNKITLDSLKRFGRRLYSPKYLIITNTMTGVLTMSIGDSIQQFIEFKTENQLKQQNSDQKQFEFNKRRNLNMMFAGLYFGVFGHIWFSFLDRRFPGQHRKSVLKKLTAEAAMGPPLIGGLYIIMAKLKGATLQNCWADLKSNLALICAVEWLVYIPLQSLNFSLLGPQFRYLYVAIISVGYDAFLSYLMHKKEREQKLKYLKEEKRHSIDE